VSKLDSRLHLHLQQLCRLHWAPASCAPSECSTAPHRSGDASDAREMHSRANESWAVPERVKLLWLWRR